MGSEYGKSIDKLILKTANVNDTYCSTSPRWRLEKDVRDMVQRFSPENLFKLIPGRAYRGLTVLKGSVDLDSLKLDRHVIELNEEIDFWKRRSSNREGQSF